MDLKKNQAYLGGWCLWVQFDADPNKNLDVYFW